MSKGPRDEDYKIYWMGGDNEGWFVNQCEWNSGPWDEFCLAVDYAHSHALHQGLIPGFWIIHHRGGKKVISVIISGGEIRECIINAARYRTR